MLLDLHLREWSLPFSWPWGWEINGTDTCGSPQIEKEPGGGNEFQVGGLTEDMGHTNSYTSS